MKRAPARGDPIARAIATAPKPITATVAAPIPARFVAFVKWLGVELSPAQELIGRVAYDGEDVPDTELARALFGFSGPVPEEARTVIVAVCGRRGGKTYILIALRLLWGMLTRDLESLAPGQVAFAMVVAQNPELRQETLSYAIGACAAKPELREMLVLPRGVSPEDRPSSFQLRRPDGRIVEMCGAVATAGGYGVRGRALTDLALDEVAFFQDNTNKVNDEDIFQAGIKGVLPGGQTVLASSPWTQRGLLYTLHTANFKRPKTALSVHAPTSLLNPLPWILAKIAIERARDPETALREYDAEFSSLNSVVMFPPDLIAQCVDESLDAGRTPEPGDIARAGADFAFQRDSSALCVIHAPANDNAATSMIRVALILERIPEPGRPLVPSETIAAFKEAMSRHNVSQVTADNHYRQSVVEHLGDIGLRDVANADKHKLYVRLRTLMREGRIRIPRHERLIRQLQEVEAIPTPGGHVRIVHKRWSAGGHGDLAEAFCFAVASLGGEDALAPAPVGSARWEAEMEAREMVKWETDQAREWWEREYQDPANDY